MGRATAHFFFKRSNSIKFQLQSQFQRFFIPNFVCVLTNKRYKTYQTGFSFCHLGHAQGWDLGVRPGGQKFNFSKHDHVAYQIEGDGE